MYTYPYQILKLRLQSTVVELLEVEWFLHQYENTKKDAPFVTAEPGAYFEFPEIETQQLGYGIQMADVEWTLHFVTSNVYENDKRIQKVSASDHAMIMDKIYVNLLNWSSKLSYLPAFASLANTANDQRVIGTISRTGVTPPHELKSLMVSKQRFRCVMYDHAANPSFTKLVKPIEIIGDLQLPLP